MLEKAILDLLASAENAVNVLNSICSGNRLHSEHRTRAEGAITWLGNIRAVKEQLGQLAALRAFAKRVSSCYDEESYTTGCQERILGDAARKALGDSTEISRSECGKPRSAKCYYDKDASTKHVHKWLPAHDCGDPTCKSRGHIVCAIDGCNELHNP